MTAYHNFIGIDIGKCNFVVASVGAKTTSEYKNSSAGIMQFMAEHQDILSNSLCILETTGGYEFELLYSLSTNYYAVHRADTRKVKSFIRSFGNKAKTDVLDAKALATYGKERVESLELFRPQSQQSIDLFQLVQRRGDLKQMLVAEKNRKKSPNSQSIQKSYELMIGMINQQLEEITEQIKQIIDSDPILRAKQKTLKTIPGIGDIVAFELLVLLPELGQLSRRQIASLAGLAPRANDSGKFQGYRRTGYGRSGIKPILFMAAMAARNSHSALGEFYDHLIAKGKKKMVALTALMRKILVIANARLKSLTFC